MKKVIILALGLGLLSTSAFAQNAIGVGTGISNSRSSSAAVAAPVQNNRNTATAASASQSRSNSNSNVNSRINSRADRRRPFGQRQPVRRGQHQHLQLDHDRPVAGGVRPRHGGRGHRKLQRLRVARRRGCRRRRGAWVSLAGRALQQAPQRSHLMGFRAA